MANFLSPFLGRLIYVCCSLSYLTASSQKSLAAENDSPSMDTGTTSSQVLVKQNSTSTSQLDFKLTLLRSTLATQIPLRLLAPILSEQSINLSGECSSVDEYKMRLKHVEFYMQIARLAVKQSSHEDLLANIKTIRTMFMNLFDLRTNLSARLNGKKVGKKLDSFITNELCKYENYVLTTFCEFTFKLSEDLFKPIFYKLFEWSSVNNPPKDRLITFYRCTFKY
jgi:U3 small nucleolar RNA-associated protein 10